jgi:hypothetical protein
MNKDALLATVIGFGVGLIIAAAVFLGPSLIKNFPTIRLPDLSGITAMFSKKNSPKPTPAPKQGEGLTIQSPLPEAIESKNETLVSGSAVPESIVVIETDGTEAVAVANAQGSYAGKIALTEGKNDIIVTSYTGGKVQTQTVTVYYTPEDF